MFYTYVPVKPASTQARLLDAAESLFSERGFQGISIREITDQADANLAAVNYHFGSKAGLMKALIERQIGPLNQLRIEELDAAEAAAGEQPLPIDSLLRIFFTAPIRHFHKPGQKLPNLLARLHQDPSPEVVEVVVSVFQPIADRFLTALHRSAPHLSEAQLITRAMFMKGAMVHAMSDGLILASAMTEGRVSMDDPEELIEELVQFCTEGFRLHTPNSGPPAE
jgi:AcrR family transcriptional regulator